LLEELGERLVSRPEIALAELIKNAFDADSPECRITITEKERRLLVADRGGGMTESSFLTRWMTIGTKNKARSGHSEKYKRAYAGSKGVGRFAARFLGSKLTLTSVAFDPKLSVNTTLVATFDWEKSTKAGSFEKFRIPYSVQRTPNAPLGTVLLIEGGEQIRMLSKKSKEVKNAVFKLTNPLDGLEQPPFKDSFARNGIDPGFSIIFEGDEEEGLAEFKSLQAKILDRFVARARFFVNKNRAEMRIEWRERGIVFDDKIDLRKYYPDWRVESPIFIDIRYFPRRAGVFKGADVDGRQALAWLRDNGGVAVIDNRFRLIPYGDLGDDWLELNEDASRNFRKWRSPIVSDLFPLPPTASTIARDNPVLYRPQNAQLVGAAFVASARNSSADTENQLIQAVNREGYVENRAFSFLQGITRTAVELIGQFDHKFIREREENDYREKIRSAKGDIAQAIKSIAKSTVIARDEKERLITQLRNAQVRVTDAEKYGDVVRQSLEQMSLLGVLSGFLTHEFEKTVFRLEGAISTVRSISKRHAELKPDLESLSSSATTLRSYLDYARLFTTAVADGASEPFDAQAQIELVRDTLNDFIVKHDVTVEIECTPDLEVRHVPLAAYSGIVLNLLTNALKSLVARSDMTRRQVLITASSTADRHVLSVSDTGIGVPETLRSRIWEPLYSTTRAENTSLGSGMGLGLTLTRRVVDNLGGKIELMTDSVPGFVTTFRVDLPTRKR
jgi:signal transduction histidine kinase